MITNDNKQSACNKTSHIRAVNHKGEHKW